MGQEVVSRLTLGTVPGVSQGVVGRPWAPGKSSSLHSHLGHPKSVGSSNLSTSQRL